MDAAGWNERYDGAELVWSAVPNQFVVTEVSDLKPGRALDLAAGEGRNAIWLAQHGWDVVAVDFASVGIDTGRRLAAHHDVEVEWVVDDVLNYRPQGQFDLVLVVYLHLEPGDLQAVLRTACDVLTPGGRLVVIGHHVDNIERGYGGPQVPAILHDHEKIATTLRQLDGIDIERAEQVTRDVDTPDGPRVALDSLVRAHRAS